MQYPEMSVVVPMHRAARTVGETVRALAAQTAAAIEVIVVDDGSADGSAAAAAEAAAGDPRFRVVSKPNGGVSSARNAGIRLASAPLVGFCDADDVWEPGKAAAHLAEFAADPALGLSFSGLAVIAPNGAPTGKVQRPGGGRVSLSEMLLRNPVGNGSTPVARRSALDAAAMPDGCWFDEGLSRAEDIDLWCRMVASGTVARGVPEALVRYRVMPDGLSSDGERQVADWIAMRDRLVLSSPEAVRSVGAVALASQYRWQARKAVFAGDGRAALRWCARMLAASPRVLAHDPAKTAATLAAAAVCAVAPGAVSRLLR